jgi:hypothetical protein
MHIPRNFVMPVPEGYLGHPHFWERAITRRRFIGTTALVSGAAMTAPLWNSVVAKAAVRVEPKPIPQVFDGSPFHFQFLTTITEPSSITDFQGIVGGADLLGTGWGTNTKTGEKMFMWTAIDNRFMQGKYVGLDGKTHQATFGFV